MESIETPEFQLSQLPNGWVVGRFPAMAAIPGVVHCVTTRRAIDVHRLADDRAAAAEQLAAATGLREVAFLKQVHGNVVLPVRAGGPAGEADGLVTDTPGLGIMGVSADCPLLLAAARSRPAVGVAHASWRGTVQQMAARLVAALHEHYGVEPADIVACICPSAGPRRYEVGPEVVEAARAGIGPHAEAFFPRRDGKTCFDLWAANRDQLLRAGVADASIHVAGVCTMERNDWFPSHRLEAASAGRFAAVIGRQG